MKRTLATVALAAGLALAPGRAGATEDFSLHHAPGAPHIGAAVCTRVMPDGGFDCGDHAVAPGPSASEAAATTSSPVEVVMMVLDGHVVATGPAEAAAAMQPIGDEPTKPSSTPSCARRAPFSARSTSRASTGSSNSAADRADRAVSSRISAFGRTALSLRLGQELRLRFSVLDFRWVNEARHFVRTLPPK